MTELEAFAAHFRLLGQSPHTLENYLATLRRLSTRVDLAEATALDLREYLGERALTLSAATIAVDVRALRCYFRWRSEALDVADPSSKLRLPKIPEPATESVDLATFTKLLASIPTAGRWNARDRAILSVLWGSGARLSEVARMRVEDLDLAAGTFTIPTAKSRRPRTVALTPEAIRALKSYLRHPLRRGSHLWWGTQGRFTAEGIKQMIARRSLAAGVHVTAHQFRRGLAERWLAAGGSETLLRYHAGWESPLMVRRYVRANGERLAIEEHRRLMA